MIIGSKGLTHKTLECFQPRCCSLYVVDIGEFDEYSVFVCVCAPPGPC